MSKDIYEYATEIDGNEHVTYCEVFKVLLKDIDCIVCKKSAADLLGYSNGGFRRNITIYTTKNYDLPYLECIIIDDLSKINYQDFHGIKVIPIEQTISDMLEDDDSDWQIILESMSNYYFENKKSFSKIKFPNIDKKRLDFFVEESKHYYDSY